jgi:hypothetical protein
MKSFTLLVLSACVAASAQARDISRDIIVETYPDFVAIDLVSDTHNVEYTVTGPGGFHQRQLNALDAAAYVELQSADGATLADGLYKWEAWATPKKIIPREKSMAMANRNDFRMSTGAGNSRISGSFRVVDGLIVNPDVVEPGTIRVYQGEIEQ